MQLKLLRSIGKVQYQQLGITTEFSKLIEKNVADVQPEAAAKELVRLGLAEQPDPESTIKAVPRSPEIGRAKADQGSVERATEDFQDIKDRRSNKTASATPATPETIGKNPHDAGK